jgi:hypothetical protein
MNPGPPEYEAGGLTTRPRRLVLTVTVAFGVCYCLVLCHVLVVSVVGHLALHAQR